MSTFKSCAPGQYSGIEFSNTSRNNEDCSIGHLDASRNRDSLGHQLKWPNIWVSDFSPETYHPSVCPASRWTKKTLSLPQIQCLFRDVTISLNSAASCLHLSRLLWSNWPNLCRSCAANVDLPLPTFPMITTLIWGFFCSDILEPNNKKYYGSPTSAVFKHLRVALGRYRPVFRPYWDLFSMP